MKKIFLTGVTGLLGPFLMLDLLKDEQNEVHVLVREVECKPPVNRLKETLKIICHEAEFKHIGNRVKIHEGDITYEKLGLSDESYLELTDSIDEIFHCAANTEFAYPLDFMRLVNVEGTKNVLDFSKAIKKLGRSIKTNYISTAYIVGYQADAMRFYENDLNIGQKFNNTYEQSKYEAEILVSKYRDQNIPINIYRTSIIVGDSKTGAATNLKTIYQLLQLFFTEFFDTLPAREDANINVVPSNEAANAIHLISNYSTKENQTYHITNNHEFQFGFFVDSASDFFNFKKPRLVPFEGFNFKDLSLVQKKLVGPFTPYMNNKIQFDASNSLEILRKHKFEYSNVDRNLLNILFEYFSKRDLRTRNFSRIS